MRSKKYKNWEIWTPTEQEENMTYNLFVFINNFFCEIFGQDLMNSEWCVLLNVPSAPNPILATNANPIMIITSVESAQQFTQYIYQLSHELTHYAIRQKKINKEITISWFEETLCEAMSLYILKLSSERWNEFWRYDTGVTYSDTLREYFKTSLMVYFENEYTKEGNDALQKCKAIEDLKIIEASSQEKRENRRLERNYLYNIFNHMPNDIKVIVNYTQYGDVNTAKIDFDKWKEDISEEHKEFIDKLKIVQPNV